jgi:hypothetical protein
MKNFIQIDNLFSHKRTISFIKYDLIQQYLNDDLMNEFFNFSNKENIWSKKSDKDILSSVKKFFDLFSKLGFVLKNDFINELIEYILKGRICDSFRGGNKSKI